MKVEFDVELQGLGDVLAKVIVDSPLIPTITPTLVRLTANQLRVEAEALSKQIVLTGKVTSRHGRLEVSDLAVEGALVFNAFVLGLVRKRIAEVEAANGPFRLKGDEDGDRLVVSWA
jgi:hypothetical protein